MARTTDTVSVPDIDAAMSFGLEFLKARRAQNLSWAGMVEQSLRTLADVQRTAGAAGDTWARLSVAQAAAVRDAASVYKVATTHLAR
jgi:hypothetical protein